MTQLTFDMHGTTLLLASVTSGVSCFLHLAIKCDDADKRQQCGQEAHGSQFEK